MNILFLVPQNYTSVSGGNIYNHLLISALSANGHEVQLLPASGEHTDEISQVLEQNMQVQVILADSLALCNNPDIFKLHNHILLVPLIHMPLEMMTPCKGIPETKENIPLFLARFNHLIVTSPYTKTYYIEKGIHENALTVIKPAPAVIFQKRNYHKKPFFLLNVANVIPGKNQLALIEILAHCTEYPWELVIAGDLHVDEAYSQKVYQAIESSGLQDRVHMHGPLDNRHLASLYAKSDLLISTSAFETFGMNVYDAACGGLPVLALNTGGVSHALEHGAGVLCNDMHCLETKVKELLDDPHAYSRLVESRQQITDLPVSWEGNALMLINKLQELLHNLLKNT